MVTPLVTELPSNPARKQRRAVKALRACRSPVYVPYRRRTARGTIRVGSALSSGTADRPRVTRG